MDRSTYVTPETVRMDILTDDCSATALKSWLILSEHALAKAETEDEKLALLKVFSAPEHWILFENFRMFQENRFSDKWAVPPNEQGQSKNRNSCSVLVNSPKESALLTEGFPLMVDFNEDISFWLFGKPAVSLSAKLTKPAVAFFVFVTVPTHVFHVLFAGQMFADILFAVGYGFLIPYCLLMLMSLQKQLATMILKKANTHYIFLASVVYTGSVAHRDFFEFEASILTFACSVPCYIVTVLFFFFMAMADASQENIRRVALRYFNPAACMLVLRNVLLVRLPGAEEMPDTGLVGFLVWRQ